jgi:site-specific recombinase XerD
MSTELQLITADDRLNAILTTMLDAIGAGSRPVYEGTLRAYFAWAHENGSPTAYSSLLGYRRFLEDRKLSIATINRQLSALRAFFRTARNMGAINEETFRQVREVKNIQSQGQKTGRWLSLEEAQRLLAAPDITSWVGCRDRAILALMLGGGLRRSEVANLRYDHLKKQNDVWVIENLLGKHNRTRTIPLQKWTAKAISVYVNRIAEVYHGPNSGYVFVSVDRHGNRRERMTTQTVWLIVLRYARQCGIEDLAPHDLRRTYAELARDNGAMLEEIQKLLGHSSLTTTQRYLTRELDAVRVSDFIPMEVIE